MHLANNARLFAPPLVAVLLLAACSDRLTTAPAPASPNMYSIGGTLSGLASGVSVALQSNSNSTTVSANGIFSLAAKLAGYTAYAVTVLTQPTGQNCTVSSGSGTVKVANVTNVQVSCTSTTYTVSGVVSGLNSGAPVVLQNNASDTTTVKANGPFSFALPVAYNGSYAVTVATVPPGQACTVTGGAGSAVTASVSGVLIACTAATNSVLHAFVYGISTDGAQPRAGLLLGRDGNIYGTTSNGGGASYGTVFKYTKAGVFSVLHSFNGPPGAADPYAGLVEGTDGNFYGTALDAGAAGNGAVYKITPNGAYSLLYSFKAGADGAHPSAPLMQGSDGDFYGTTEFGGTTNSGTVFKITAPGVESVLYSFLGGSDGLNPSAGLIQGSDGNFYGTTASGGTLNHGTVFKITPAGVETVLYSFQGSPDGSVPSAELLQGSDGNFYGTAAYGGNGNGGIVFKLTPAGVESVLYAFQHNPDGADPRGALIQGSDGNFYGTTVTGGTTTSGTIFMLTPTGVETVLHSFQGGADGKWPMDGLIVGSGGNFFGVTEVGGTPGFGTLFSY